MQHITSLTSYDQLANFSSSIITEVIALLNPAENSKTRVNAGKCLQEICQGLINHGAKEESVFTNYYLTSKFTTTKPVCNLGSESEICLFLFLKMFLWVSTKSDYTGQDLLIAS